MRLRKDEKKETDGFKVWREARHAAIECRRDACKQEPKGSERNVLSEKQGLVVDPGYQEYI